MEGGKNLTEEEKKARYKQYRLKPLTQEKENILFELFPHKHKSEIAPLIGYSTHVVDKYAQCLGIRKTAEYMHNIAVKRGYRLAAHNKNTGFKPKGRLFKAGESIKDMVGEEAFREIHKRAIKTRSERYERERRRILCGWDSTTKQKLIARPKHKLALECRLRKFGYTCIGLNRWMRPETGAERHKRMEQTALKWGYKIFDYEQ